MLRFFGKQNSDKTESSGSRLSVVEWKVNLILVLVGIQLALTTLILVRQYLIPSTTTLILCGLTLAVIIWLFRKQIPGLVKRMLFRHFISGDSNPPKSSSGETDDAIR